MKKEIVKIRVDGSSELGLGHLVRCYALAHMLKEEFNIIFYVKEITEEISDEILTAGLQVIKISKEEEFLKSLTGDEIVVLDHYGLGSDYQLKIKSAGSKLVCIDDLYDKKFYADLIINHAPGNTPADYKAQPYTKFALGLDFALLRPAFLKLAQNEADIKSIRTVMICFGGADSKNLTRNVLSLVSQYEQFETIKVVLGSAYKDKESLKEIIKSNGKIEVFESLNEKEMAGVLASVDLAIIPASGILIETIASGSIPIICYFADNQKLLFDYFLENSTMASFNAVNFEEESLHKALKQVLNNQTKFVQDSWRNQLKDASLNHMSIFKNL